MDFLRNLFGNLTSGLIRLGVTAGILFCAYLFIVKPALDTTRDISKEANDSIQRSFRDSGLDNVNQTIDRVNRRVQREIRRSLHSSRQRGDANRLIRCIQRSHHDVNRIQRCAERY